MKFSPILSRSGSSLAISSISGKALASLSVDTRDKRSERLENYAAVFQV